MDDFEVGQKFLVINPWVCSQAREVFDKGIIIQLTNEDCIIFDFTATYIKNNVRMYTFFKISDLKKATKNNKLVLYTEMAEILYGY